MKKVKYYSDEFKLQAVKHYLSTSDSLQVTADKFGIPAGASVFKWVRIFESEHSASVMEQPNKKPVTDISSTPEEMARRIQELEQALESERLKNLAANKMIDIAERDLNISIRKKSGAKR